MGWDGGSGKRFDHSQLSTRKGIIPENSSPEFSRQSPRNFVAPLILKSETNGNTGIMFRRRQSKFSNLLRVCQFQGSTTGSSLGSEVGLLTSVLFIAHWR